MRCVIDVRSNSPTGTQLPTRQHECSVCRCNALKSRRPRRDASIVVCKQIQFDYAEENIDSNSNGQAGKKSTQIQPRNASKPPSPVLQHTSLQCVKVSSPRRDALSPLPRSNNFNLMTTKRMMIDFKFKSKQFQKKVTQISTKKCVENRAPEGRNRPSRYSQRLQPSSQRAEMHLFDHRKQFRTFDFLAVCKKNHFFFNLEKKSIFWERPKTPCPGVL